MHPDTEPPDQNHPREEGLIFRGGPRKDQPPQEI